MNEEIEQPIIIDGLLVMGSTGEIIGLAQKEHFTVDDEESCRWVLSKIAKEESALSALDSNPDVLAAKALLANVENMKKDAQRRLHWLLARFSTELGQYAKPLLPKGFKTLKTPYGFIQIREVKPLLEVKDKSAALQFAKSHLTHAVKQTEEFQIGSLTDIDKMFLCSALAHPELELDDDIVKAFSIRPAGEKVEIKTGVKA